MFGTLAICWITYNTAQLSTILSHANLAMKTSLLSITIALNTLIIALRVKQTTPFMVEDLANAKRAFC